MAARSSACRTSAKAVAPTSSTRSSTPCARSPGRSRCSTARPTPRTTARCSPWPATPPPLRAAVLALFDVAVAGHRSADPSRRASAPRRRRRRAVRPDRGRDDGRMRGARARDGGRRSRPRFELPVFLYEDAATTPAAAQSRGHPARRVRRTGREDGVAGVGARLRPAATPPDRRRNGHRRPDAAHRLQHQPRDRPARRRQADRRRDPPQQRRVPLREGAWASRSRIAASSRSR